MSTRVIIIDDHKIMREGLRSLLEKQPETEVVAEAENAQTALKLIEELTPDLVIIDVVMPGLNGIETTRRILTKTPSVKVIALSMYSDKRFVMEMLRAGASGYLLKDCAFEELDGAIHAVTQGRTYITPRIVDIIVKDYFSQVEKPSSSALSSLTSRQYEVLQLLAEGKTTREIAQQMSLSIKTIESHRQQIISKLNIRSIAGLTKYAIREGLISPDV